MFGVGGSELIVILVIALIFLGPDKLPDAAKQISKGIRDLKKQSRILQEQIENDEHIGGALRDIKSALRGDEAPARPPVKKPPPAKPPEGAVEANAKPTPGEAKPPLGEAIAGTLPAASPAGEAKGEPTAAEVAAAAQAEPEAEPDPLAEAKAMIKPAAGIVAKGEAAPEPTPTVEKHG